MATQSRSPTAPFFVCFGTEDFFLDRDIERAKAWNGRTVITFDGHDLDDSELVSLLETQADPRTIIIDDAQKMKGDKSLRRYIEEKVVTDLSTILVAIVRTEKLPEVWSQAVSKGKGFERKKPPPWELEKTVIKWLETEATRLKITLDKDVPTLLFQYVGGDYYRLANELRKLAVLVGHGKVEKKHLILVTSPSPTAEPHQIAEATIAKEPKKAMNLLSTLLKNQGEEALVPVVASLMRQVEKTLLVRRALDKGMPEDDIATTVGMKLYPLKNFALPVARKHDTRSLVRHMGRLCRLDSDVKGPARSKRTLIELAVLAIAG